MSPERRTKREKPGEAMPPGQGARRLAIDAARLAANTRCREVLILDFAGLWPVADYFVIATGSSPRQMRTVLEEITDLAKKSGYNTFAQSGADGQTWMVADFVDVVVHLFSQEARVYYDLENLWGDAPRVGWEVDVTK
jgi:ribosome-associated protein